MGWGLYLYLLFRVVSFHDVFVDLTNPGCECGEIVVGNEFKKWAPKHHTSMVSRGLNLGILRAKGRDRAFRAGPGRKGLVRGCMET